jgi:hypothetical protein
MCVPQASRNNWLPLHEILYLGILRKSVEKIQVSSKSDKNNQYTFLIISHSFLLKSINVSERERERERERETEKET